MNAKQWKIVLIGGAVLVALYFIFRNMGGSPQLVSYPDNAASGVPVSQNPATTWNIQTPQPAPSPAAIYAPAPQLPPAPGYQSYNYAPVNILGLTPEAAAATPAASSKNCDSGCCSSCSSCPTCPTGGTFGEGVKQACLAANPVQQAASTPGTFTAFAQSNLESFFGTVQ